LQRQRQYQKIFYLEIVRVAMIMSIFPIANRNQFKPRHSIYPVEEIAVLGETVNSHDSPLDLPSIRGSKRSSPSFPNIL